MEYIYGSGGKKELGTPGDKKEPKKPKLEINVQVKNNKSDIIHIVEEVVDVCSNFDKLAYPDAIDKKSLSDSSQVLALLNDKRVFLKIFTQKSLKPYNGLLVEAAIYFCAIAKLIKNYCPFFIKPISYQECDGFLYRLIEKEKKDPLITREDEIAINKIIQTFDDDQVYKLQPNMVYEYRKKLHPFNERSYIIINEQLKTTDLNFYKWFETFHSLELYQSFYFQLLWTLACFERIGLRHNDLHGQNIYIRRLNVPEIFPFTFVYQGELKIVYLKTNIKIIVNDFDRSTIVNVTNNTRLNSSCKTGFGCQTPNYGFDLVRIICYSREFLRKFKPLATEQRTRLKTLLGFLKSLFTIQGKNFYDYKFGEACQIEPKDILIQNLIYDGYDKKTFIDSLDFNDDGELIYDYDYIKILSTSSFFESIRSYNPNPKDLEDFIPEERKGVIYKLPDSSVKKEIDRSIIEKFPSIVYSSLLSQNK